MSLDFVLVHGSWHDNSAWAPVIARLEQQGHRAWAPTVGRGAPRGLQRRCR